jgi:hypothetical protein
MFIFTFTHVDRGEQMFIFMFTVTQKVKTER